MIQAKRRLSVLDMLKSFFNKKSRGDSEPEGETKDHDIRLATCALFVEIARIDEQFTPSEMEKIISILNEKYGLSREHADALVSEAEKELDQSVDLWQFARLINENYTNEEKMEIVETMWRIVYVDGKMDQYEHYLMNKLKNLFRLSHDDLIGAKQKVLHGS
jgi:uncharacterized tellurite resistance protein B-like protein